MKRFLISPPFGNYVSWLDAERIMGSYTWEPRPGRFGQIVRTVRPVSGGWINKIGLRNPGIRSMVRITTMDHRPVYSLAGIKQDDWSRMADWLRLRCHGGDRLKLELNLSCPNVREYGIQRGEIAAFTKQLGYSEWDFEVIAKLPPTEDAWPLADLCAAAGVHYLHFSNTLPTPYGGVSGDWLRWVNLPMVERAAKRYPGIPIIAGGGIKTAEHVRQYEGVGARHFSIATGCLHPLRTWRAMHDVQHQTPELQAAGDRR